jgi:hypothetical protein
MSRLAIAVIVALIAFCLGTAGFYAVRGMAQVSKDYLGE